MQCSTGIIILNGFEKSRLPCTQQQDTHFTIEWKTYALNNNSGQCWCWMLPRLLLLWLVSGACQTSMSACVSFKWLHIPMTSRQPVVFTMQLADEFSHGFSCFVWYVEVKMVPMNVIWLVLVNRNLWQPLCGYPLSLHPPTL